MTAALTLLVMMMVMLMIVALAFFIVIMVVMMFVVVALALFVVIMVMMLVVVALAFFVVIMVMMLVIVTLTFFIMLVMVMMLMSLFQKFIGKICFLIFHNSFDLLRLQLFYRCSNDMSTLVEAADQLNGFLNFLLICHIGAAQNNSTRISNLIREKFSEISQVHFAFFHIRHCGITVELDLTFIFHVLHSLDHIGQLSYTGGFNNDAVRMVFLHHLHQRCTKITYQGTADAAGIHLADLNSCFL